jgi:hypothetical protein
MKNLKRGLAQITSTTAIAIMELDANICMKK